MTSEVQPVSEEKLIESAKGGDKEAFGLLVEKYQDMVFTLASRTLGNEFTAEDVAQDAFVRAWQALPAFKSKAKFSSWLYRITLNVCFTELRKRQKPVDVIPDDELDLLSFTGEKTQNFESLIDRQDLVDRLIDDLPPIFRSIVVLHYLENLDCKEISSVLGRPVGTVKAYLHRARAKLRSSAKQLLKTRSSSG
jgi:RNA polymerase sigma-70 factor (ECF subfamily)